MSPLVRLHHVTRRFDAPGSGWMARLTGRSRAPLTAVSDVSLEIASGSVYALVGESGSGKTTLGRMVAGLLTPSSGRVELAGIDPNDPAIGHSVVAGIGVQMIFQDPFSSLNPRWRVGDIVTEPLAAQGKPTAGRAGPLLEKVGLDPDDARRFPHAFSGGQRQRIAIARALSARPRLVICDEPTSALDVSVQAQVLNLMRDLQREYGLAYLFISHDLAVVRHMADRVGVLYLGRLVEEAPADAVFAAPRHPYTRMLLDAAPGAGRVGGAASPPMGEIPDPARPPSGCAFHPRCPLAEARCRTSRPDLRTTGQGRRVACHLAP